MAEVKHNRETIWACAFAQALYDWGDAEEAWHSADRAVEAFNAEYARREALRYAAAEKGGGA